MEILIKDSKVIGDGKSHISKRTNNIREVVLKLKDGRVFSSYSFENLWEEEDDKRKKVDVKVGMIERIKQKPKIRTFTDVKGNIVETDVYNLRKKVIDIFEKHEISDTEYMLDFNSTYSNNLVSINIWFENDKLNKDIYIQAKKTRNEIVEILKEHYFIEVAKSQHHFYILGCD